MFRKVLMHGAMATQFTPGLKSRLLVNYTIVTYFMRTDPANFALNTVLFNYFVGWAIMSHLLREGLEQWWPG